MKKDKSEKLNKPQTNSSEIPNSYRAGYVRQQRENFESVLPTCYRCKSKPVHDIYCLYCEECHIAMQRAIRPTTGVKRGLAHRKNIQKLTLNKNAQQISDRGSSAVQT